MEQDNKTLAELNKKITLLEETLFANQIGYWELYLDSDKVIWSDVVYDIHELPRNLGLSKTQGINYYHPDYQEIVSKAVESCIVNAEPFNIECILITAKKNEKWVRATGRKKGNRLLGSFQDITDIKNQELKFKGIFNSTFTFIGFLDTKGILLEANDTAVNLAGIKHSDVIGKYFWDCYWWQISEQAQEELKVNFQKALSGKTVEYEVAVWIANKTPITILFTLKPIFDDHGKVIYVIPEGRPVQELVDSRRRYKSVLEGTNVGTWEWNVQTGETKFNERWADIVGYTLEELAPISIETWIKLAHPDDLEESGKRLTACFEKKSEFYEFEARMKHKDGHWVWVHDRGKVMVWTDDGKPLWMYGTHQDISKRKKAEEESKRTSILLEAAQSMAKIGAWELDLATGKTFWTDEVYHIHEVTKDFDHNKVNGIEFYHPDYRPIITKAITESIEKQIPFNVKCKLITAKNNLRWVRSSGYPLLKEGKVTHLIGMFRDVTEEEEAKEAIIREQSFSKQLLENMADGFSVVDFEGKQIGVNKAFCEMTGFSEEELIGQTAPYPYWPEEELENIGKAFQQTLAGELSSFELTFKRKNDNRFPVLLSASALLDENGNPISYFANIKDITERNKAEQELKDTKQKLDSIFSEMDDVVWSVSLPDYKMLFMTPSAVKLYGIPYEEFMDDSSLWEKAIYQDDKPIIQSIYQQLQENGNYEQIYRIASRDGKIKWVSNKGKMIHNEQGIPIRIDGVLSDISERKKAEQELVKTKDMLLRTGEVAKVGGWEFNNLTGEITWSDTICDIHEVPQGFTPTYEQMASFYTPESWVQLEKAIQDATTNGVSYDLELKIITAKGKEIWVRAIGYSEFKNGKCVRLFGVLQDISIQKKAELMIVQSREQYQSLVQNIPGITYRCKNDKNWTMLYMSSQVDSITGYTAEEFMGSNSTISYGTLIHPEDQQMVTKAVNNGIAANMPWAVEYRVRHKDGSIRWAYEKGAAIKNEKNEVLYLDGFILDITAERKAQQEVRYQQQILESLYQLSPIGIALNDYETGAFIDCNDKLLEPTGYSKEEFLSLSYLDVTPKKYEKLEAIALQQMETKGKFDKFEKEYICKDGSRYPVSLQGVVVTDTKGKKLIWSFIRDISQEKEAERKLKEAIAKLQAILDASKQVSIIVTDTQGTITLFNSGAEQMLGYRAEELVGQQTPVLIHLPHEIEKESDVLSEKYGKEISGFETFVYEAKVGHPNTKEWTYITKDGHQTPVLLSVNKISVGDTITGYLGVATDITELKKVEKEIRSLLSITEEQNDRLKNFAHIVSHNLRSHSIGIRGILELFKLEYPDLSSNEYYPLIESGVQNLTQTVEELTEIVKVNLVSEEFQNIHIADIVEKNIITLSSQINKSGIKIFNEIPQSLQIKGIPPYIDSIILNLITNAIKYKSEQRKPMLKIYHEEDASTISLFFEDNGLGIDLKKHGDKLFGMYKTFHRHDDSRGVGLFITKNQVESMGGKITVDSEVNVGTTFKITLNK